MSEQHNKQIDKTTLGIIVAIILGFFAAFVTILSSNETLFTSQDNKNLITVGILLSLFVIIFGTIWLFFDRFPKLSKLIFIFIFSGIICWKFHSIAIAQTDKSTKTPPINKPLKTDEITKTAQINKPLKTDGINPDDSLSILPMALGKLDKDINISHQLLFNHQLGDKGYGTAITKLLFNSDGIDLSNYEKVLLYLEIDQYLSAELYIREIGTNIPPQTTVKLQKGKNTIFLDRLPNNIDLTRIGSIWISAHNQNYKTTNWLKMQVKEFKFIK